MLFITLFTEERGNISTGTIFIFSDKRIFLETSAGISEKLSYRKQTNIIYTKCIPFLVLIKLILQANKPENVHYLTNIKIMSEYLPLTTQ